MLSISFGPRSKQALIGLATAVAIVAASSTAAAAAEPTNCPATVNPAKFASKAQLRQLVLKENSWGHRFLASPAHNDTIDWIQHEMNRIDGFKVKSDQYKVWRWLPKAKAKDRPGLDLARAGGLQVTSAGGQTTNIADAGAVRWSKPTGQGGRAGQLAYLPKSEAITAANSAGKVVVRDFPSSSLPYGLFGALGTYVTPDLANETGDYARPFLNDAHGELLQASAAGAAGLIFVFDVPAEQIAGYGDPHTGTKYPIPGLYVGDTAGARLKALAAEGASARVEVQGKIDRAKTRNVIATLPGRSPEKIILATNTDGQSPVQEDGVAGLIAFARHYAKLPLRCRPRTIQIAFGTAHDAIVEDGMDRYSKPLDKQYEKGRIAFTFAVEHLGTREILPVPDPDGSGQRLEFTGKGEAFLFAAGDSDVLRGVASEATQRRNLDRTAVMPGIGVPVAGQAPPVCSMGGLGNFFHRKLIPSLAVISGPWSLYAPSFGVSAINFKRMRSQMLAVTDSVLALDGLPREEIAGDYTQMRIDRANGAPVCPPEIYPQFAPGPGI